MFHINNFNGFDLKSKTELIRVFGSATTPTVSGNSAIGLNMPLQTSDVENRFVVVSVAYVIGATRSVSSLTVNGVGASLVIDSGCTSTESAGAALFIANNVGGSSANVVATFNGSLSTELGLAVYSLYNLASQTASSATQNKANGSTSRNTILNVPSNGIVISTLTKKASAGTITWSNVTKDSDVIFGTLSYQQSQASAINLAANASYSLSATLGTTADCGIASAAWQYS